MIAPTATEIEAAARALWRMGNLRIGERPWETVCAHYITEATAALEAAAMVRREVMGRFEAVKDENGMHIGYKELPDQGAHLLPEVRVAGGSPV